MESGRKEDRDMTVSEPSAAPLRVYLGTAPGVGKTYAMLNEGWRRAQDGEQVVVGWWERHGRPGTAAQIRELEVVPPRSVRYRDRDFEELDVDEIIRRHPDVALVDELAHTTVDDRRPRWQDVQDLLDAGITVLTTVNVANLDSVSEFAALITGAGTAERVPDSFVRDGEVTLVDLPPEALRRRVASGQVYADGMGGALSNYFRVSNLSALSELAHAWVDGTIDHVGPDVVGRLGVTTIPGRPAVLAGVTGSPTGEAVLRRAAELAQTDDADLVAAHIIVDDGLSRPPEGRLAVYRDFVADLGGMYLEISGTDVATTLAGAARERGANRVVVGRHRSRLEELWRGSIARRLRRLLPDVVVDEVRPA
jgi:two-component system sensor histidine kinase KdpD